MKRIALEVGQSFGRLTVLGLGEPYVDPRGRTQARWLCRCECGQERNVWASALVNGKVASCGCSRKTQLKAPGMLRRQEVISYFGMHRRLWRDRGKASGHPCVDCNRPARSWSYVGGDPDELYYDPPGKRRLAYSMDSSRYVARCTGCHNKYDGIAPPASTWRRKSA